MHTMARVKNLHLADGDVPEPLGREIGEAQVVEAADRLVANTEREARELVDLYDADPARVAVAEPGVDLATFTPGVACARRGPRVGIPADAVLLLFVGRIQPLKAPDVLVRAAAELVRRRPDLRSRLVVGILGGASGTGVRNPMGLTELAEQRGIADLVRFVPPVDRPTLAQWYRAADVVAVPSHNESFGLVAVEAQACGTPVVAANVGGLPTAVGPAGVLVDGHDTADWATALAGVGARPRAPGGAVPRLGRARRRVRLGAHRRAARGGLRRRDGPTRARRSINDAELLTGIPHGGHPVTARATRLGDRRGLPHATPATSGSRVRAATSSSCRCRARRSSRPWPRSWSPTRRCRCRRSSSATPTRTTTRSTASSCAATCACRGWPTPSTRPATSTSPAGCPAAGVDAASLDQLLGVVLDRGRRAVQRAASSWASSSSMRKEWEWRVSRGESLRNLEAFRGILARPGDPRPADQPA